MSVACGVCGREVQGKVVNVHLTHWDGFPEDGCNYWDVMLCRDCSRAYMELVGNRLDRAGVAQLPLFDGAGDGAQAVQRGY